ncbi:MAG TPA: HAD-IB family hydrolase [Steroidobacteraceae bacterium]|nr:HAD-IB family hydrolase [Steroidobacteraceae bacterium]
MHERNLAIFDLDGTITRHDTLVPYIAGFLWRHPWRLWRWLPCLVPLLRYAAGPRDRGALKSRVIQLTLGGVASAPLAAWAVRYARRLVRSGLYAEALECITAHQRNHDHLVLLSASPDLYVPEIAQSLGFDACICTELRWRADDRLDGALSSPNRRGPEKAQCVAALLAEQQPLLSYAYGNSPADLEHLKMVSAGTYVNGEAAEVEDVPNVRAVRWSHPGVPISAA